MGGHAFKPNTRRIPTKEYLEIKSEVLDKLSGLGKQCRVPDSFKNKDDHGDLDVLLTLPIIEEADLKRLFNITDDDIVHNTTVVSFRYKDFQIDLCHFEPEHLDSAFAYYRQSDCSNMVGVLAKGACGYRLTHKGLTYPIKLKPEDSLGEVIVSKDHKKIFEFLDLNYDEWFVGFENPEQLFTWIADSKYFNKEFFAFESLNHENRTRNRKRAIYAQFVEWCEQRDFINNYKPSENKQEHLFRGLVEFHSEGFWIDGAKCLIDERVYTERARKNFNGFNIMQLVGATGPQLGKLSYDYKQHLKAAYNLNDKIVGYGSVNYFVANKTTEELNKMFLDWYYSL